MAKKRKAVRRQDDLVEVIEAPVQDTVVTAAPIAPRRHVTLETLRHPQWVFIGLGLAIVLLLASGQLQQGPGAQQVPLQMERHTAPATHPGTGTYPEVRFLLERRERLRLTPQQAEELGKVQAKWERDTLEDRRALLRASEELTAFLRQEAASGSNRGDEARRRGEKLSALSGAIAAQRYRAWQEALTVLTDNQRTLAEAMRAVEALPWKARAGE